MKPRRSSRGSSVALALGAAGTTVFVTGCMVTATAPGPGYPAAPGLEWNVDRPGADYRSFDLPTPSPEMCQSTCVNEPQCVAFTYMNPGVQGPNPRCWLKNAVPEPVPQTCCVSGIKYAGAPPQATAPEPPPPVPAPPSDQAPPPPPPSSGWQGTPATPPPPPPPPSSGWQGTPTTPPAPPAPLPPLPPPSSGWQGAPMTPPPAPVARQWEPQTDRPGADYRSFDLRAPRPELCRDACWNEPQCRSFTYARPGVQGPHARCYLKNVVPPARANDCCLSGVK